MCLLLFVTIVWLFLLKEGRGLEWGGGGRKRLCLPARIMPQVIVNRTTFWIVIIRAWCFSVSIRLLSVSGSPPPPRDEDTRIIFTKLFLPSAAEPSWSSVRVSSLGKHVEEPGGRGSYCRSKFHGRSFTIPTRGVTGKSYNQPMGKLVSCGKFQTKEMSKEVAGVRSWR